MKYAVAIDIGGTNTRVALIDEKYKIEERAQFSTDADNPDITLFKIKQAIERFDKEIVGVGMSCPGPLDLIEGKILTTPNLHGKWHGLCITKKMMQILQLLQKL